MSWTNCSLIKRTSVKDVVFVNLDFFFNPAKLNSSYLYKFKLKIMYELRSR